MIGTPSPDYEYAWGTRRSGWEIERVLSRLIFTNLWGSSRAIHSCIFYHRSTRRSDCLHIYPMLINAALLRVGWRGGLSSHKVYTWLLARLVSTHYWGFCFYNIHCTIPWTFVTILRDPLHIWGFHFDFCVSRVFRRRLWRCRRNCLRFTKNTALRLCPDTFGVIFSYSRIS